MYREHASLSGPIFTIFNGCIGAIDPGSGRVRWTLVTDTISASPAMVADETTLYVFVGDALLAVASDTGQIRWRIEAPVEKTPRLELHAGLVLVQGPGRLYAYGIADGALRWEVPSSCAVVPSR